MNKTLRKIQIYLLTLISPIILFSCGSTKSLIIEIPQPSGKELPASIQSLALVTRIVDEKFTDLESDSIQKIFYTQDFNYDTVFNDFKSVDTTLQALGELLFETGRYDFVIPQNRFLPTTQNSFFSTEMSWREVKQICSTYKTDAVLSLDHFKTRVSTNFEKESFYDSYQNSFYSASVAKMQVYYEALFRVYDPLQEKVVAREFFRDTLLWEDADRSARELFKRFTPVKTALTEAGIAVALDFSDKIGMRWREERRYYFYKGNSNFSQAGKFINNNDWVTAMALWKETAESAKSKSEKSKAQFNVAVGYELQGDINKAISWALKSYNSMYRSITYDYLELLKKRKNELKKQNQ